MRSTKLFLATLICLSISQFGQCLAIANSHLEEMGEAYATAINSNDSEEYYSKVLKEERVELHSGNVEWVTANYKSFKVPYVANIIGMQPATSVGPAGLILSNYLKDSSEKLGLVIKIIPINNLLLGYRDLVSINLNKVLTKGGENVLSSQDNELFLSATIMAGNYRPDAGYIKDLLDIPRRLGTLKKEIVLVEGELTMLLPVDLAVTTIGVNQMGEKIKLRNSDTIYIRKIESNSITIEYDGDPNKLINIHAHDSSGTRLIKAGNSESPYENGALIYMYYHGQPERYSLISVSKYLKKNYPFRLKTE